MGWKQIQSLGSADPGRGTRHDSLELLGFSALSGAGCSPCLLFCSPSTPAACAPPSCSALPCSAAWSIFPARVPKALSILAVLYWNTCFPLSPVSQPWLLTSHSHYFLARLPLCQWLCQRGRRGMYVPALPGVAFLVPHSYSGMKLGLQL